MPGCRNVKGDAASLEPSLPQTVSPSSAEYLKRRRPESSPLQSPYVQSAAYSTLSSYRLAPTRPSKLAICCAVHRAHVSSYHAETTASSSATRQSLISLRLRATVYRTHRSIAMPVTRGISNHESASPTPDLTSSSTDSEALRCVSSSESRVSPSMFGKSSVLRFRSEI